MNMQSYYMTSSCSPRVPTHMAHIHMNPHYLLQNEGNVIGQLQIGKAQDHDGLVDEHVIYAQDILLLLLVHIVNRDVCEGSCSCWTEHNILPILKSGDPMTEQ